MGDDTSFEVELEDAVKTIVGDHLGLPGVTVNLEMPLGDEVISSWLDRLEIIMTAEEVFDIRIEPPQIGSIHKVVDLVGVLSTLLPHRAGKFDVRSHLY